MSILTVCVMVLVIFASLTVKTKTSFDVYDSFAKYVHACASRVGVESLVCMCTRRQIGTSIVMTLKPTVEDG